MGDVRPGHLDRYLTVPEVTEAARRLTAWFPGVARLHRIGRSPRGPADPDAVRGARAASRPGGRPAAPRRPVGGVTALALAEHAARSDRRSPATDPALVTWDIILCLDRDGAALSVGLEAARGRNGTFVAAAGFGRADPLPPALVLLPAPRAEPLRR
ncbi:hypothetical protein [Streptomyces flaveolus]|uniref:hypothetical protein n=1 Tax=Streptomyces flaveolus TaxID=67297 RepID=UPI00367AD2AE